MHFGFLNFRSIKASLGLHRAKARERRSEAGLLCGMMAVAGILFVSGALLGNPVSVLLSLFAALACVTRVEQKQRNGDYGRIKEESVD